MENNQIINQDPPTEEITEEETEPAEEGEEGVLDAAALKEDINHLKTEIKTMMNNINHLIDIVKDKKGSPRLVIKNQPPKQKTNKDYLLELFPAVQEYNNNKL